LVEKSRILNYGRSGAQRRPRVSHPAQADIPPGTSTIRVLLIVTTPEYRRIKELDIYSLPQNAHVCTGVVSKNRSYCIFVVETPSAGMICVLLIDTTQE